MLLFLLFRSPTWVSLPDNAFDVIFDPATFDSGPSWATTASPTLLSAFDPATFDVNIFDAVGWIELAAGPGAWVTA